MESSLESESSCDRLTANVRDRTSDLLTTPCVDDDDDVDVPSPLARIHGRRMDFPPQPGLGVCDADDDDVSDDIAAADVDVDSGDRLATLPLPVRLGPLAMLACKTIPQTFEEM